MKLQKLVIELAQRGCLVLLSNSTAPEITGLYHQNDDAKKAGLKAYTVPARRLINSRASKRHGILKYLIANLKLQIRDRKAP